MLPVKEKLRRGDCATMVLINYSSPALVEQMGRLGFDIAMIDCEKGSATAERVEEMCRGARAAGIAAVVRPWSCDAGLISRYLDLGADGVMVAGIEDAAAVQDLVQAVRYARYKDYQDKFVIVMIESPRALENLPAMLAVEGVDAWFIGSNDLAHRMGFPGRADLPVVREAVRQALATIGAAGGVGGTVVTCDDVADLQASGARLVLTRVRDLLTNAADDFHGRLLQPAAAATTPK